MSRNAPGWLENPSFRAHLFWVVLGTTAALLVMGCTVLLVPLLLRFDAAAGDPQELGRLADRILALHATLWPFVGICLGAVCVSSWLLYRRMVSPLVRFVQVFHAVRDGRLPGPIQLRAFDYLSSEADALNEMSAALRAQHGRVLGAAERLRAEVEEIAEATASHGDAELARLVAALQDREKALADELRRVRAD